MAWIILGVLVVITFLLIGMYNSLVQLRVRTDNARSDIALEPKRRHDSIANVVEPDGRYDSEFASLLQRRGARSEYENPVLSDQFYCRYVWIPATPIFRGSRNRPRTGSSEVLV